MDSSTKLDLRKYWCALLVPLLWLVPGCPQVVVPQYALVINPSESNAAQFNSKELQLVIDNILEKANISSLLVVVAAEDPLSIPYDDCRDLISDDILARLEADRLRQIKDTESYLDGKGQDNEVLLGWGAGTDHGEALREVATMRKPDKPLIVVVLTDGFNEHHPMEDIDTSLKSLFATGPTRVIVLGLSPGLLERSSKQTVKGRWQQAFQGCDSEELQSTSAKSSGCAYYLSTATEVPSTLLGVPFVGDKK